MTVTRPKVRDDGAGPATSSAPEDRQHPGARSTYDSAVASGFYERDAQGLHGKYDNVRRYWEDQITRQALRGFMMRLVARKRRELARIRVLDLGAGSGEGYQVLTSLRAGSDRIDTQPTNVVPSDILGFYKGIDISPAMVHQGRKLHLDNPKIDFKVGDLSHGLGACRSDLPYDLYYSSYGSLSHLKDGELERVIGDIYEHCGESCIFVADLLGRYSYEWQCYWSQPGEDETNMRHYSMSYLYPESLLPKISVERFPVRYWGAEEFDRFIDGIVSDRGGAIARRVLWDRSIIVGRHMNTGEFNPHAQPIRSAVNRLLAFYHRTDLQTLLFNYGPHHEFSRLNQFFESFQMAWNAVIYDAMEAIDRWKDKAWLDTPPREDFPGPVREAMIAVRKIVRNIEHFRMDDPLANVIEPQLGYNLRNLEVSLQRGLGAGHGLLAIYELKKP
jgi:SAM-dependent methyltransferase